MQILQLLENTNFSDNVIECKCLCRNKNYRKKVNGTLQIQFCNTYTFSNHLFY